ncbi:MAG: phosphatase PAP2 family protein [Nanoarchaeota archaeon]|nr:phosphatase PAP2 family protein [Nanoarchaeota archaeon]MBU1632334.1 phosphatase PAP2 family protein [Nanoarchaeota archaeon]MBU1876207.1 phosphatase PAP2 family protein [Nanoarchaeota archaeon]
MKDNFYQKQINQLFRDVTSLGSFIFFFLILILTLALQETGLFFKLLIGLIFIMFASLLIRIIFFKNRPRKQEYNNLIEKLDASSFPSIHTARIIFQSLIFINFFNDKLITYFFILLSILVSYSRVYLKKHDWFDLLGGLILAGVTFWITSFLA